jgi:F-type H+-transporting ATPase subunit alpha
LQSDLFNANQRPAVDVGISVSRVGGDAQTKAMKKIAGTLKISLAQYRSLESFAMFASDLDAASKAQLARGERLTELLKQPQYTPFSFERQAVSIWAGTHGKLDDVPVADISRFEHELHDYIASNTTIFADIASTEDFTKEIEQSLGKAIEDFRKTYVVTGGVQLVPPITVDKDAPQKKIVQEKITVPTGDK